MQFKEFGRKTLLRPFLVEEASSMFGSSNGTQQSLKILIIDNNNINLYEALTMGTHTLQCFI